MKVATRRTFLSALACAAAGLAWPGSAPPALAQAPAGKLVLYTSQPERDAAQTVAGFPQGVSGRRGRGVPLGHDGGDGQARRRVLRRPAEGRRAADRRRREHGGAQEGRPPAGLSGGQGRRASRRAPSTPTARTSARSSSPPASRSTPPAKSAAGLVGRPRQARVQGPDRDAEPALLGRRRDHARHDDGAQPTSAGATSRSSRPTTPSRCAATAR